MPKRVVEQESGRSMRSMFGHSALAVLGTLVVLIVGAAAVGEWLGWPFLRAPIERAIEKRVQREVSFGDDFRLSIFGGLWLRSDRFSIGAPADRPPRSPDEFVQANDVELRLPYGTVFGQLRGSTGPLRVKSFSVAQLSANLWRGETGRANWEFGGGGDESAGEPVILPQFDRLVVREGRIRIDDAVSSVHAVVDLSTEEGTRVGNGGGLKVAARGTYQDRPLRVQLASSGLLPLAQASADEPLPIMLKAEAAGAKLDFDGHAADVLNLESLRGRFALSGPTLAAAGKAIGLTLPNTPAFDMKGEVRKSGRVWQADIGSFAVGDSDLSGAFTYDPQSSPPMLSGALRGDRLVLADLAPAVGAPPNANGLKKGNAGKGDGRGKVLPERSFDIPSLKAMNAAVEVDLKRLDLPSDVLRSIAPLHARLTLDDGVLKIDRLSARTADGQLRGALSLDSNRQPPSWTADLGWSAVDLAKWIAARSAAAKAEPQPYITGTLSGQAKVAGSGRSTAAILGSLDGEMYAWVRDGTLSHLVVEAIGLDIAQGLGLLATGDDPLPLQCAVARLKADDGVVRTELFLLDTPDSTVFVDGNVLLDSEQLKLTLTARPKDFSPLTVRAPVHVTGSFADPNVAPDAKTLGVKAAAAALLAAINPLAALIPLMDPADPATRQCIDIVQGGRDAGKARKPSPKSASGSAQGSVARAAPKAPADFEASPRREPVQ